MDFSKPHYELNLPMVEILKDHFELIDFSHRDSFITAVRVYEASKILKTEILSFFEEKKLGSPIVQIFCSKPGDQTSIHIDGQYTKENTIVGTSSFAINFIVNGDESTMSWYYPNIKKSKTVFPKGKRPFSLYENEKDIVLLDSTIITKPSLVRIDIPHQVKNFGKKTRWAISLRFPYNKSTWKEIVEQFDDIII